MFDIIMQLGVFRLHLKLVCLVVVLLTCFMLIAPSLAFQGYGGSEDIEYDIGEHSHGKHPHFAPISLSKGISSSPVAIGYLPIGTNIMGYQIGIGELPYSPLFPFYSPAPKDLHPFLASVS